MHCVERIQKALENVNGNHIVFLYGKGIQDRFLTPDNLEIGIDEAMLRTLKEMGYQRIAFLAPHRPVFFLDSYSKIAASPTTLKRNDSLGLEDATIVTDQTHRTMKIFKDGPLGEMLLFEHEIGEMKGDFSTPAMGDAHGIRFLDTMLKDDQCKTAVVILQAETTLRYFDDHRTLAGIVGEWQRLPAKNKNICFLVFSAGDKHELVSLTDSLPVPELQSMLRNVRRLDLNIGGLIEIGGPDQKEIVRLFEYFQQTNKLSIKDHDRNKLAIWMAIENICLREWIERMGKFPVGTTLDIEEAKKSGWFTYVRDHQQTLDDRLAQFVGLEGVKRRFKELSAWIQVNQLKQAGDTVVPMLHMIFSGNPGTGKTSMARLIGEVYHDLGLLKRGHLVEAKAAEMVADHVGGTALKTSRLIDSALDGVLFIDEAYMLSELDRGGFGKEAVETLLTRMEDEKHRLVVIAAGYPLKMKNFLDSNPGLFRRFPRENHFSFEDYSSEELWLIFLQMLEKRGLGLDQSAETTLKNLIHTIVNRKDPSFGNAGEVRNLVEALERVWAVRVMANGKNIHQPITVQDIPDHYKVFMNQPVMDLEMLWQEFDHLIGLQPVKRYLKLQLQRQHFEQIRSQGEINQHNQNPLKHLVFLGNPGTGKTSVARLLGKIFHSMGLLARGHVVEVSRANLVAGYVGQTAERTLQVVQDALDGILFIDEAYTLSRGGSNDFGQEVLDTLVKCIEDYSDRLVVIVAGYPLEMERFFQRNPGLRSRFPHPINFPDFTRNELVEIIQSMSRLEGFILNDEIASYAGDILEVLQKGNREHFGNARTALALYEHMKNCLADRFMTHGKLTSAEMVRAESFSTFVMDDLTGFCDYDPVCQTDEVNNWLYKALSMPLNENETATLLNIDRSGISRSDNEN